LVKIADWRAISASIFFICSINNCLSGSSFKLEAISDSWTENPKSFCILFTNFLASSKSLVVFSKSCSVLILFSKKLLA
jgi:hypothetical protein